MSANRNIPSEILLSIGLFLLIFILLGVAPGWYDWYSKDANGVVFKWLFNILDGSFFINIPICIMLSYVTYLWCYKIWIDQDIRYYRPFISILGLVALYCENRFDYAKIVLYFNYKCFFTILLAFPLAMVVFKLISLFIGWIKKTFSNNSSSSTQEDYQLKGFSDDNISKKELPDNLKKYAKEIVDKLLETDIKEQSFALGVTGEWGVGKTTFLEELKKKVTGRADIIEFNPWMCSSPEQVTNDFFATLRRQLSPKHSRLSNPIKEYAKYIGKLSLSSHIGVSLDFLLPIKQESLFERKQLLSCQFAMLPRPVVVIIDDMDRLERDEVFEVLRLIRNTADLSNMVYIVAYDKEYVTCVLEEKNIKDSSAYLEKIFPIEVHLPKVEQHLIWDALFSEIDTQNCFKANFAKALFLRLGSDDKELILTVLDNYRRVKRFARLYMLNVSYMYQNSNGEMKLLDVFWLELLQMYDKKSYDKLMDDKDVLLYRDGERFKIRDGVLRPLSEKDKNKFKGNPFWKEDTPRILQKLFGENISNSSQSICYAENYDKYFTLGVSKFRLSIRERNELLNSTEAPYDIVKKWIDGGKYLNSIVYQLRQVSVDKLDEKQLRSYIQGILSFSMLAFSHRYNQNLEVKKLLFERLYPNDLKITAHNLVQKWFKEEIYKADSDNLLCIGKLLNKLYVTIYIDENGNEETFYGLVIKNDEIEVLLVEVMRRYLIINKMLTALEILKENSKLANIFKCCCVTIKDVIGPTDYCVYKQVAYDTVIEYFAAKKDKPTYEEYENTFSSLFSQGLPPSEFDDQDDEYDYWEHVSYVYENKMSEYFGSSYNSKGNNKLTEFKIKCFVPEKTDQKDLAPSKVVKSIKTNSKNVIQNMSSKPKKKQHTKRKK